MSRHCSILDWVRSYDDEFADALEMAPQGRILATSKSVTFLYPTDEVYRNEIRDAEKSKKEKLISSLIINRKLTSCSDFIEDKIGTLGGVACSVDSVKGITVKLRNGTVLKKVVEFCNESDQADAGTAIWYIMSGRMPLDGEKFSIAGAGKKHKKRVTGGYADRSEHSHRLAKSLEEKMAMCIMSRSPISQDPYLRFMVSLFNYLKVKHTSYYYNLLPLLDYEPIISFYIIVEPYKTVGTDFYLPHEVLFGSSINWETAAIFHDPVEEYKSFFDDVDSSSKSLYYINRESVFQQIDAIRNNGSIVGDGDWRANIERVYDQFGDDVFPMHISGIKRLWQDQVRMMLAFIMDDVCSEMSTKAGSEKFLLKIKEMKNEFNGNDHKMLFLGHSSRKELTIDTAGHDALLKFVNSTDFLYIPPDTSHVRVVFGDTTGSLNPNDSELYNRNYAAFHRLVSTGSSENSQITREILSALGRS